MFVSRAFAQVLSTQAVPFQKHVSPLELL